MSEQEKYEAVNATESTNELITLLESIDGIQSRNSKIAATTGTYWANRLGSIATSMRLDGTYYQDVRWNLLTRTYGIRQQAMMHAYYEHQT